MADHIGVGCVGQGAMALASFNAPAQLMSLDSHPGRAEVVVMLTQIAHRLRADTAGPDIAIRGDLRGCYTGHAGDDLALLNQGALDDIVIAIPEGLRDLGDATKLGIANALLQALDHWLIPLDRRGNAHAHCIQLNALFRDFTNERIRLEFVAYKGVDTVKFMDIE